MALVPCVPYRQTPETHQCLVLTNPDLGVTKVFDATDNQFVLSPIAYFPLVIEVGKGPNQIATLNNQIFTLDPIAQAIYKIPDTFISPITTPTKSLDFAPNYFVLLFDLQTNPQPWALVSSSSNTILEAKALGQGTDFQIPIPCSPDFLQINPTKTYLVIACKNQLYMTQTKTLWASSPVWAPLSLPGPSTNSVRAMTLDSEKALLALTDKTLVVVNLANWKIESTQQAALEDIASAVYLPSTLSGTPSTCCNGEKNWVGALLNNGKLQYWPYNNQQFNQAPQSVDIPIITGLAPFTLTNPVKLLGVQIDHPKQDGLSCERRLFLVCSGSLFNLCEGSANIKKVDLSESQ